MIDMETLRSKKDQPYLLLHFTDGQTKKRMYAILEPDNARVAKIKRAIERQESLKREALGDVLYWGYDAPSPAVKSYLAQEYGITLQ